MSLTNTPISYNKQTPRELMMFTEIIVDVYSELEKVSWSNNSQSEIGFSLSNKVTKSNIFFGIWYEAWESFEVPLCYVIDFREFNPEGKIKKAKNMVQQAGKGLDLIPDYQGFTVILVKHEFLNFKNDGERLSRLFKDLCYLAGVKTLQPKKGLTPFR